MFYDGYFAIFSFIPAVVEAIEDKALMSLSLSPGSLSDTIHKTVIHRNKVSTLLSKHSLKTGIRPPYSCDIHMPLVCYLCHSMFGVFSLDTDIRIHLQWFTCAHIIHIPFTAPPQYIVLLGYNPGLDVYLTNVTCNFLKEVSCLWIKVCGSRWNCL